MRLFDLSDEQQIQFAEEVKRFLSTNIARYIFDRAADNIDAATKELVLADPDNSKAIRDLQSEIKVNQAVGLWFAEAIQIGEDAKAAGDMHE